MTIVNKFLKKIISSASKLPQDMGELCRLLKKTVNDRFPDHPTAWTIAMGALIFLRFICPAIVAPDTFGLVQAECGAAGRRCLVLVTKVLQNLVNDVEFKAGYKEEYMTCMNPFLEKNKAKPLELYNNILKRKEGSLLDPKVTKRAVDENTCTILWKIINANADKLADNLEEDTPAFRELVAQLREAERHDSELKEAAEKEAEAKTRPEKKEGAKEKKKKGTKQDISGEQTVNPDTKKHSVTKEEPPSKKTSSKEMGAGEDQKSPLPVSEKSGKKDTPQDKDKEASTSEEEPEADAQEGQNKEKGRKKDSPAALRKKHKQADAIIKKEKTKKRGSLKGSGAKSAAEPNEGGDGGETDGAKGTRKEKEQV